MIRSSFFPIEQYRGDGDYHGLNRRIVYTCCIATRSCFVHEQIVEHPALRTLHVMFMRACRRIAAVGSE